MWGSLKKIYIISKLELGSENNATLTQEPQYDSLNDGLYEAAWKPQFANRIERASMKLTQKAG